MRQIFKLKHKNYTAGRQGLLIQFFEFCFVGVSNAVVYYAAYASSLLLFRKACMFSGLDYQVSHSISFIISTFWAFSINRKYVFAGAKDGYLSSLCRFYITYAFTGLLMNSVLLFLWKKIGISEFMGPFINILFTTSINFILSKKWAFKYQENNNERK